MSYFKQVAVQQLFVKHDNILDKPVAGFRRFSSKIEHLYCDGNFTGDTIYPEYILLLKG